MGDWDRKSDKVWQKCWNVHLPAAARPHPLAWWRAPVHSHCKDNQRAWDSTEVSTVHRTYSDNGTNSPVKVLGCDLGWVQRQPLHWGQ